MVDHCTCPQVIANKKFFRHRCCLFIASRWMTDWSNLMRNVVVGLGLPGTSTKWAETLRSKYRAQFQ